jgi:hypothetical protein
MKEIFDDLQRIFYEHFNDLDRLSHDQIENLEAKLERIRESRDIFHGKAHASSEPEDSKAEDEGIDREAHSSSEPEDEKIEDKGTPGEAHMENKSGFFRKLWNGIFGSRKTHEETKQLLMDLKALEMSIDQL